METMFSFGFAAREIMNFSWNVWSLPVFMPNITTNYAITYTKYNQYLIEIAETDESKPLLNLIKKQCNSKNL
jgi:hypothetical protein